MILEISDYLLIRYMFLDCENEDIIKNVNSIETYQPIIKAISSIMQEEDFFLIDDKMPKKIEYLIQKYRFTYRTKELARETNYIIERLNDYKQLSQSRKNYLIKEWVKKESKERGLPSKYSVMENLTELIVFDAECIMNAKNSGKINLAGDDAIKYISFFNLIRNKFNIDLNNEFYTSNILLIDKVAKEKGFSYFARSMAKKSVKSCEKQKRLVKKLEN